MSWQTLRGRKYYVLTREVDGIRFRKWMGTGERAKQACRDHEEKVAEIKQREREARSHDLLVDQYEAECNQLFVDLLTPFGCIRDSGRFRKPQLYKLREVSSIKLLPKDWEGGAPVNPNPLSAMTGVTEERSSQGMIKEGGNLGTGEEELTRLLTLGRQIREQGAAQLQTPEESARQDIPLAKGNDQQSKPTPQADTSLDKDLGNSRQDSPAPQVNEPQDPDFVSSKDWRSGSSGTIADETRWMIEEPPDSQLQTPNSLRHDPNWRELVESETTRLSEALAKSDDSLVIRLLKEQVLTHSHDYNVKLIHDLEFEPYDYYRYNHRFHNRRLNRAHQRLTKAMSRLVRVRAMNLPHIA